MADPQMLMTEIARELYPAGYVLAPTPGGSPLIATLPMRHG